MLNKAIKTTTFQQIRKRLCVLGVVRNIRGHSYKETFVPLWEPILSIRCSSVEGEFTL